MRALRSSSEIGTTPSVILFSWRKDSGGSRCCKSPGPAKANPVTPADRRRKSLLSVHIMRAMLHDLLTTQQVREIYQPPRNACRLLLITRCKTAGLLALQASRLKAALSRRLALGP